MASILFALRIYGPTGVSLQNEEHNFTVSTSGGTGTTALPGMNLDRVINPAASLALFCDGANEAVPTSNTVVVFGGAFKSIT